MTKLVEDKLRKHMKSLMMLCQQQRKTGREHGFTICKDGTRTNTCKGERCTVTIKECKDHYPFATAHSHPVGGTNMPSSTDVASAIHNGEKAFCICGPMTKGDFLKCYELNWKTGIASKFITAYLQNDMDTISDLVVNGCFNGNETTLFQPVINKWNKKRKK